MWSCQCLRWHKQEWHKPRPQRLGQDHILQLQHQLMPPSGECERSVTALPPVVWSFYTTAADGGSPNHIPSLLWAVDIPVLCKRMYFISHKQASSKVRSCSGTAVTLIYVLDERPNWLGLPQLDNYFWSVLTLLHYKPEGQKEVHS